MIIPQNPEDYFKFLMLTLISGGAALWWGLRRLRLIRQITDTAASKVATAPQGHVELQGFAWPDPDCMKTLEGKDAVYYSFKLERYEKRGKNSRWVTVYTHTAGHKNFYLCDHTGAAHIDVTKVKVNADSRAKRFSSLSATEKKRAAELVGRAVTGFPPATGLLGLFSRSYRCTETFVMLGSPVYALGYFETATEGHVQLEYPALKAFIGRMRRFKKDSAKEKSLLDVNRDGKVSHAEMTSGYQAMARSAFVSGKTASGEMVVDNSLGGTGTYHCCGRLTTKNDSKGQVFSGHESHVLGRFWHWHWLAIVVGALLIWLFLVGLFFKNF